MFAMAMVHKGERGPGGGSGLVADLGIAANYTASKSGASPVTSTIRMAFHRNGTWSISQQVGPGGTPSGGALSGNWATAPSPLVGDDFEVRFNAGAWQLITADRYVEVTVTDNTADNGPSSSNTAYTVDVRKFGTTAPVVSDSTTLTAQADYTTV